MTTLVTGAAGFIGSRLSYELIKQGETVLGIDNLNSYYDVNLKKYRLEKLASNSLFKFIKLDLSGKSNIQKLVERYNITKICHLAAQAGVRYSLKNPEIYIKYNIDGFLKILEICRKFNNIRLVYASSSSVYGGNKKVPFAERDPVNHPISIYAATKRSNELMAHVYSHLYDIPSTGLRFFTVYGPWGRPDMALFKFVENIIKGKPIELYNSGNHSRDFSYIDNVVDFISSCSNKIKRKKSIYEIFNVGFGKQTKLMHFLDIIEKKLKRKAKIKYLKFQKGDMKDTYADTSKIKKFTKIKKTVKIEEGIANFIAWFKNYYLR